MGTPRPTRFPQGGAVAVSACALLTLLSAAAPAAGQAPKKTNPDLQEQASALAAALALGAGPHGPWLTATAVADVAARAQQGAAVDPFWFPRPRRALATTAQLVGIRDPFTAAVMRAHGVNELIWDDVKINRAPELDAHLLRGVRDDTKFPRIGPRTPEEFLKGMESHPRFTEYLAYTQAFVLMARTPPAAIARSADDNARLTYSHLFNEPARFRGEVVRMEGRLISVVQRESPIPAAVQGVPNFYEGWVFLDRPGVPPVCVVFIELPDGLKVSENLDRRVSFEGYFFKRYVYESGDNKLPTTLLFVAQTLKLAQATAPRSISAPTLSTPLLLGILGVIVATAAVIFGMSWHYRRGDRRVRDKLLQVQMGQFLAQQEALEGMQQPDAAPAEPQTPETNGTPPDSARG